MNPSKSASSGVGADAKETKSTGCPRPPATPYTRVRGKHYLMQIEQVVSTFAVLDLNLLESQGHGGVEVEHMDGEPAANGGPEKFFGLSTKEWGLVALGLVAVVGLAVYVKRRD